MAETDEQRRARARDNCARLGRPIEVGVSGHEHETVRRYLVPSTTAGAAPYYADLIANCDGVSVECDCPAGLAGRPCWHREAVILEWAGELADPEPAAAEVATAGAALRRGLDITIDDLWGPSGR